MSTWVWVSKAPADSSLADGFTLSNLSGHGDQQLIRISQIARRGGVLAPDELPEEIWGEVGAYRAHHFPGSWPDISYYSGLWIISAGVAPILEHFDLGGGVVVPVRRFQRDHVVPVPEAWFCWNVGNTKAAFIGERSQGVIPVGANLWLPLDVKDHDLKCAPDAAAGPDAWYDPRLHDMLFLSASLGEALIAAGLATEKAGFGQLIKCAVVHLSPIISRSGDGDCRIRRPVPPQRATPHLIALDDVPAHPYAVAMEVASLAPNAETTLYPWRATPEHIDTAVEHARRFLKVNLTVSAWVGNAPNSGIARFSEASGQPLLWTPPLPHYMPRGCAILWTYWRNTATRGNDIDQIRRANPMNPPTDQPIFVQVVTLEPGRQIGWGNSLAEKLEERLDDIRAAIKAGTRAVAESVDGLPSAKGWELDEVSASFGLALTAEAGVILSRASAEATFEVTVTFKRN